jgi:putative transposase
VITELRQFFPLPALLKLAGMARSTFYYQCALLTQGDKYEAAKVLIRKVYDEHKGRYGYRRITAQVRKIGHVINHKCVQRLMGEMGLKSLVRPKKYRSYNGTVGEAAPHLLERNFQAQSMHEKWVTDVTEFKVADKKLYLSPILDLCNGEIIAYEMRPSPEFGLVMNMLKKAFRKLGKDDKPMIHSDQGWHYRKPAYKRALAKKELVQSMSRKGNCLDNARMESFFAVLKTELFKLQKFSSIEELKTAIAKYIRYYNNDRIKSALNNLSPVQYRAQIMTT